MNSTPTFSLQGIMKLRPYSLSRMHERISYKALVYHTSSFILGMRLDV